MSDQNDKLPDLLPCPFCGAAVELERAEDTRSEMYGVRQWWGVVCRSTRNLGGSCAIEQGPSASPAAAIERWNRRATPAPQAAPSDIEELKDKAARIDAHLDAMRSNEHYRERVFNEIIKIDAAAGLNRFARIAAAPAVAITQAATSEPVATVIDHDTGESIIDACLPVGTQLYAAPVAHLAGTTPNTEAPSVKTWQERYSERGISPPDSHGAALVQMRDMAAEIADLRAALSAQQAGVQAAPSEDAKDERVHELDAAMSLLRVALTVDAGKVSPAALRKQVMESVAIAAGADGEGEEYIYADVYGHLCELIGPYVLSDERPEGYPFTASVTDTMSMLIEHYQRTAALAAATQTEKP